MKAPFPIPYQGSKRGLADLIIGYLPDGDKSCRAEFEVTLDSTGLSAGPYQQTLAISVSGDDGGRELQVPLRARIWPEPVAVLPDDLTLGFVRASSTVSAHLYLKPLDGLITVQSVVSSLGSVYDYEAMGSGSAQHLVATIHMPRSFLQAGEVQGKLTLLCVGGLENREFTVEAPFRVFVTEADVRKDSGDSGL